MDALAWSNAETNSHTVLAEEFVKLETRPVQDMAGNITGMKKGSVRHDVKGVMIGSHLDAVTNGGRYDGRAGVLVGLAVLKMLHEENRRLSHDVMVQVFRGEESSRFGKALLGSSMATGQFSVGDFDRTSFTDDEPVTLDQAMKLQGLNTSALKQKVEENEPLLPLDHIGWYIEPHIEQAGSLADAGASVGLATGIFGNMRADVRLLGQAGHTGSTPTHLRRDANYGMMDVASIFKDVAEKARHKFGADIRDTIPVYEVLNAANTTIPSDVKARFEVRSLEFAALTYISSLLEQSVTDAAEKRGLIIHEADTRFNPITMPTPHLSTSHIDQLEKYASKSGIVTMQMPSGASHDVQRMHEVGIDLVFIIYCTWCGKFRRPSWWL